MEIFHRDSSVNAGYILSRRNCDGRIAYFFMSSATHFGTFRSLIRRFRNRKYDLGSMKRAIVMSSPGDIVYVLQTKKNVSAMTANLEFVKNLYRRTGINYGDVKSFCGNPYRLIREEAKKSCIATIIYDPLLHRIYKDDKLMRAVTILNDKEATMNYLRQNGIDVPKSLCIKRGASKTQIMRSYEEIGFPCYTKGLLGGGGFNIWRTEDEPDALELLKRIKKPFQIQEYIPGNMAINIQYLILPDRTERLLVTNQRIKNEKSHMGNDWPVDYTDFGYADAIAEKCRQLGFLGVLGLDLKEKLIEINPRQNSSGEMQIILKKIPGIKKLSILIRLRKEATLLKDLFDDHLWFDGERGIIPFEWMDCPGEMAVALVNDFDGSIEAELLQICPQN